MQLRVYLLSLLVVGRAVLVRPSVADGGRVMAVGRLLVAALDARVVAGGVRLVPRAEQLVRLRLQLLRVRCLLADKGRLEER